MTTREKIDALCKLWPNLSVDDVAFLDSVSFEPITREDERKVDQLWEKYGKAEK